MTMLYISLIICVTIPYLTVIKESHSLGILGRRALLLGNVRPNCYTCRPQIQRRIIINRQAGLQDEGALLTKLLEMRSGNLEATAAPPVMPQIESSRNLEMESISEVKSSQTSSVVPFGAPPPEDQSVRGLEAQKALACAQLACGPQESAGAVCACNYKTGNVVTFKNECDLRRHNCRFDTEFKVILNEICPWQFESRSGSLDMDLDYNNPSYYNH